MLNLSFWDKVTNYLGIFLDKIDDLDLISNLKSLLIVLVNGLC